jgi:hypothetical protein
MGYDIIDGVYKGPEVLDECINLTGDKVSSLGVLKKVKGNVYLNRTSSIKSLDNLECVMGSVYATTPALKCLGRLSTVKGELDISGTNITYLDDSLSVGNILYLPDDRSVLNLEWYRSEALLFFKSIPKEDYPLHMNHENWIVRSKVNRFLETGEV